MANTTNTNPRDALKDFIGGYPYKVAAALPALDASLADIEASGVFKEITDKESYLAWVQKYKAVIKLSEAYIRELKSLRKTGDVWEKAARMERQVYAAHCVTCAIHLRRLGKIWSIAQRNALQQAA